MNATSMIDERLGGITMYRSAIIGLLILAVTAFVLMLVGEVPYHAGLFLLSVAMLVVVSQGSNRLFGWLFSVQPHRDSAIITALILALLFTPPDTLIECVKLALVAIIAMASKYVIAPRGRHMFNPAAIAIVIASISGLAYASWWLATPSMIPVTVLVAVLMLYKTQKVTVGMVFIAVAVVSLLLRGTDLVTALTSWPIIFVAGIMLTEPLTLPPRRKQQYVVAALIGLLMTQPFSYWEITMTPALALVLGNVVGWWYGQRRLIKLRYVGKKQLTDSTYELTFDTQKLHFEPGQYIELTLPHNNSDGRGMRRMFSIVGVPGDEQLSIGTKVPTKPSSFKRALLNLKVGDTLFASRIAGDFVLPEDTQRPVVLVAGGIGVTPYISYYLSSDRPFRLIYAVNKISEISFIDQLVHHASDVTIVSLDGGRLPDREWRHVKGGLDAGVLRELIGVSDDPIVYIAGPPAMVTRTHRILRDAGIRHIKVDEFTGY